MVLMALESAIDRGLEVTIYTNGFYFVGVPIEIDQTHVKTVFTHLEQGVPVSGVSIIALSQIVGVTIIRDVWDEHRIERIYQDNK
jgi:hypothetical protein